MAFSNKVKVFATRGSDGLAREVCGYLRKRLPKKLQPDRHLTLGMVNIEEFSNENIFVQVENVRDHFVIIFHTQTPPVNKGIIELFHLIDAINNARASDILIVFSCIPYARADKKDQPRISVFSKVMADILNNAFGVRRVILLDPHDTHIKHYFKPSADEISAIYLLIDYIERNVFTSKSKENSVVVFSDTGAAKRYGKVAELLGIPEAYIPKQRNDNTEKSQAKRVVGDVKEKFCLLVDDEIMTGGTAINDAKMLLSEGATSVIMLAVYGILADKKMPQAEMRAQKNRSRPYP